MLFRDTAVQQSDCITVSDFQLRIGRARKKQSELLGGIMESGSLWVLIHDVNNKFLFHVLVSAGIKFRKMNSDRSYLWSMFLLVCMCQPLAYQTAPRPLRHE